MLKINPLYFLYCVAVFTLTLGQFALIGRGEANFYVFDLVVGIFAVFGLAYFLVKKSLIVPKGFVFLRLFIAIAGISLLKEITTLGVEDFAVSFFYLIRLIIYFISGVICFNMLEQKIISLKQFLSVLFYSAFLIAVAGFVQLIVLPDFTILDPALGWDPHKNRLASTFFDPNFTGGFLSLSIGLAFGSLLLKKFRFSVLEIVLFIIVPSTALFLTFSRSSWGMLAVILFVLGFLRARKVLLLGILIAFFSYFAVPRVQTRLAGITDPADSAAFRLVSWKNSITIAEDNLWLGVGYNAYRYAQRDYGFFDAGQLGGNAGAGSDSSLLFVLATTGIVGIFFFTLGLTTFFLGNRKETDKDWKIIIFSIFCGILLQSQFINSLFYPQILFFWMPVLSIMSLGRR